MYREGNILDLQSFNWVKVLLKMVTFTKQKKQHTYGIKTHNSFIKTLVFLTDLS